jgi:predicted transcriptional regulator
MVSKHVAARRVAQTLRRDHARRLYEQGQTLRQIAAVMRVSYQAVHSLLRRQGVPMRPRGGNRGGHSRHAG